MKEETLPLTPHKYKGLLGQLHDKKKKDSLELMGKKNPWRHMSTVV